MHAGRIVLIVLGLTSLAAAEEPDVPGVVSKLVAAVGGPDKLLKLFRVKEQLIVNADISKPGTERTSVLEPPKHWWVGKRERVSQEKEPAIFLVWTWTLGALTDPQSKLELLPEMQEGEVSLLGLRISGTISPPLDAYFSKADHRLVRIDWRKDIHRFSEWRQADGVSYPSRTIGYKPTGKPWYKSEILELTRLQELPEGLDR